MTEGAPERGEAKPGRATDLLLAWALILGIGAGLVGLGVRIGSTAGKHGGYSPEVWAFATLALALLVFAFPSSRDWVATRRSLSALIVLVTAQLVLTNPMWLQHFNLSSETGGTLWSAALVAIVVAGILSKRAFSFSLLAWVGMEPHFIPMKSALPAGSRSRIRAWHVLAAVAAFVACGAHLTRYVGKEHFGLLSWLAQLGLAAIFVALNAATLAVIFSSAPVGAVRWMREGLARANWERKLPWILAAWTVAASLFLGWIALDQVPHIPDELSYLFQAECFARGVFWGDAPPNPAAFEVYLITAENGRWFAVTPPGWPAVLAIGCLVKAPWIVNPLLGGLAVLLAHALTKRFLGVKAAHLTALLMSVSPWLLYLSASYMTHPVSLVLMLAAWLCLARSAGVSGGPSLLLPLLAGALLGWLALVRQLDAVLVAGITGLGMLGLFGRRQPWFSIVAFAAGFVGIASLLFAYNAAMTGDPKSFPINAYLDRLWYPGANRLGFGADVGNPTGGWGDLDAFPGHGLRDVLINTNQNLYATTWELFGWCIGSLFFVFIHLFFGKKTRLDKLMMFTIAVLFLGYHLYWYSGGSDFGARYWYLMIYPLVVLTVRGITTAVEGLRQGAAGESAPDRMAVVLGTLIFLTLVVFIPWRAVTRYKNYRGFHADYVALEKSLAPDALVFVKAPAIADFDSALIRNSPLQTDRQPIFAADLGAAENQKMIDGFPDRPVYHVVGRSVGDGPTRIVSGPESRGR